jgi:cytoskeletal protein RodZ
MKRILALQVYNRSNITAARQLIFTKEHHHEQKPRQQKSSQERTCQIAERKEGSQEAEEGSVEASVIWDHLTTS